MEQGGSSPCMKSYSVTIQMKEIGNPNPVGFYRLDGITGLNDTSACMNLPGTSNGVTLVAGYIGEPNTAYRFNGSKASYVRLPTSENFNSHSITLLAWVKTENSAGKQTILQFSSVDTLAILLAIDLKELFWRMSSQCEKSNVSVSSNLVVEASTWYFIGFSFDEATRLVIFWINEKDESLSWDWRFVQVGSVRLDTHHDIWLGYGPESPGAFNGSIACVQIFNRVLEKAEVEKMQKTCLPRDWSEPFAMYTLTQSGVVLDISGYANPSGTARHVEIVNGPYDGEKALKFMGRSTSYISILHRNGELQMDASFSVTVWIYRLGHDSVGNIITFDSEDQQFSGLTLKGLLFTRLVGTLYIPSTNTTYELGLPNWYLASQQWFHIALIYNHQTGYASLYVNGNVYDVKLVGTNSVGTSEDVIVGKYFHGRIACLQLYRRPLLAKHVQDAKDKCYRGKPDPPTCPLNSHVMHSSCPSSSLAVSLSNGPTATSSRYVTVTESAASFDVPEVSLQSTIQTSTLRTVLLTQTQPTNSIANTSTIASTVLVSITSTIGAQSTAIAESRYESSKNLQSTLENSQLRTAVVTRLQTTSLSNSDSSMLMSITSNADVQSRALVVSSQNKSEHLSTIQSLNRAKRTSTTISVIGAKNLSSQASHPTPLGTLMPQHVSSSVYLSKTPIVPTSHLTASVTSSSIKGREGPAEWTHWGEWSSCSKPCGTGNQTRTRLCNTTEIRDCTGEAEDTRVCNSQPCEAVIFNITAIIVEWPWDDSLLIQNSDNFTFLEDSLRQNIRELYCSDPRFPNLVDVKLLSCWKGSVIVHFNVIYEAVDSNQVIKLMDGMETEGLLSSLPVVLVNVTTNKVPNQTPTIVKAYVTSATSIRVSWKAVDEPVAGYQVAYRSSSSGEWNSVFTAPHMLSLQLENLIAGDVYRVKLAAFNSSGNGIPSKGVEIRMEEGVPKMAPVVSVSDKKSTSFLIVSWTVIPEEYVTGQLLGYHVMYKPIKVADQKVEEAVTVTITAPASGKLEMNLTSLSAFTLYSVTVTGFTAMGDGLASRTVFGETCFCPKTLYTNWALHPPYVTELDQQPSGIIGELFKDMILYACGTCKEGQGETVLDITHNGKEAPARKDSMGGVRADVDDKTHVSFPVIGNMEDEKYLKDFVFIPVVKSPGIAFITLPSKVEKMGIAQSAMSKAWPVILLSLLMGYIVALLIWLTERDEKEDDNFSQSFVRGTMDLTWFSLMTMTTVGFGEKVPVKVVSKLLTIVWILVGLVLISIFVASLTVSFNVMVVDEKAMIYGTQVTVLKDSPGHRLGILRNARVDPKETLEEALDALENRRSDGVLLDAYVAGSSLQNFIKTPYRVRRVIETSKGMGVVLSGDAVVLRFRVRDFIKKNAKRITEIIENSTTPVKQPEQSVAEEKAQSLVSSSSTAFQTAIAVTAGALAVSYSIGVACELVRRRQGKTALGKSLPLDKFLKTEMKQTVDAFHVTFSQAYQRLRVKHLKQIKMHQALARQQTSKNAHSETKL